MRVDTKTLWNVALKVAAVVIVVGFVAGELVSWRAEVLPADFRQVAHSVEIMTQLPFIGLLLAFAYRYWSNLFNFLLSE